MISFFYLVAGVAEEIESQEVVTNREWQKLRAFLETQDGFPLVLAFVRGELIQELDHLINEFNKVYSLTEQDSKHTNLWITVNAVALPVEFRPRRTIGIQARSH